MAKKDSTAAPSNPLIDKDDPLETLHNVKGVITYLDFTVSELIGGGSNDDATHGLAMILECAMHALDHATQAVEPKELKHA